jgi:hypothetical protein
MSPDYIDIPSCPKCENRHRYELSVERSMIMKLMTVSDVSEEPRRIRFTRLFTCPVKNEEFQASFALTDTSSDRIKSVQIVGIASEHGKD